MRRDFDPTSSRVAEWMTGEPMTATPDMDAEEAAEMMMTQGSVTCR